jgi:hypothetical protein
MKEADIFALNEIEIINKMIQTISNTHMLDWMEQTVNDDNYNSEVATFIAEQNVGQSDDMKLVLCPNFTVCHQYKKQIHMDCWGGYCLNCDIAFRSTLDIGTNLPECSICMENNQNYVVMPGCTHKICTGCFRECFREQDEDPTPQQQNLTNCAICREPTTPTWKK